MIFNLKNLDLSYVNALRRIILSSIPNVAISENMEFIKNTGSLHNEFMAHRISLIPCCFDKEEIDSFQSDKYAFEINVENKTKDIIDVTTKDIKVTGHSDPKKIFPPSDVTNEYILITRLKPEQALHVKFHASKGVASTHAKWSPVSLCTLWFNCDDDAIAEARKRVPKEKLNHFDCIEKNTMYKKNDKGEPNDFSLAIESECRLTPKEILKSSVQILKSSLLGILNKMQIESIGENMFAISIEDEELTLLMSIGNVIQSMITNLYINKGEIVKYCGYYNPHPLENVIIIKIGFTHPMTNITSFMQDAIKKIITDIDSKWDVSHTH